VDQARPGLDVNSNFQIPSRDSRFPRIRVRLSEGITIEECRGKIEGDEIQMRSELEEVMDKKTNLFEW
jgi:hypothetical protein